MLLRFSRELPEKVERLARQVLNRTAQRGRTQVSRVVTGEVELRKGYVDGKVRVTPATETRPEARITAEPENILLSRYDVREAFLQTRAGKRAKQGVTVKVGRTEGRKYLPFAFLIRVRGNELLVTRSRTEKTRTGKAKLRVRYGPSVDQIFNTVRPALSNELRDYALAEMTRRINVEVNL